jgi:hypothetical protein
VCNVDEIRWTKVIVDAVEARPIQVSIDELVFDLSSRLKICWYKRTITEDVSEWRK